MQQVRFIKKHPPYNVGETAGFSEAAAETLRKSGYVEFVEAKSSAAKGATAKGSATKAGDGAAAT
ncbi:hypothetical protein [Neomegalonema perideroedes]|uniref:hypothetical protein n=1 Tax=Neomegalonema perideroedes TaxID=217219 RepID=UPI0003616F11|nr:hypothetical protein [Neomegalonema perideroedes]